MMSDDMNNMTSDSTNYTNDFNKFMQKRKVGKDEPYTHTYFGGAYGKYFIQDSEYKKFISLYEKTVKEGKQQQYIIEYPKDNSPLCIDIDVNLPPEDKYKKRQYTKTHVKKIIVIMNDLIKKYTNASDSQIKAYVTEKKKPTVDYEKNSTNVKRYKDGFHIMYPKVISDVVLKRLLLDMCEVEMKEQNVLEGIDFTNDMSDVVDKRIASVKGKSNGWTMYGSKKEKGQEYKLTYIYNAEMKGVKIKDGYEKLLTLRGFSDKSIVKAKNTDDEYYKQALSRLDMGKTKKKVKVKPETIEQDVDSLDEDTDNFQEFEEDDEKVFVENKVSKDELEKIKKIVSILSPKRAYYYESWTQVGWCLRNIDKRLLSTFKKFSKEKLEEFCEQNPKVPKKKFNSYDAKSCEELWKSAREHGSMLTNKSLYYWARSDNCTKFLEITRESIAKEIALANSGTNYDVANVMYKLYGHQYVCASITKNKWYEFQKHRWVYVDSAYTLKNKMSTELANQIAALSLTYITEMRDQEGNRRDEIVLKHDKTLKLIDKLKTTSFKESVLKECCALFYDPDFEERLDSNKDLLGFDNGVYDLKNGIFRDGCPEDHLTFSVKYNYKEYSKDHKFIKQIDECFSKIQPEKEMKEYMLFLFSSYLDGHIKKQVFPIFTGYGGSNGKSASLELLSLIMGDYASSVPHTLLTRKRGSAGSATPELADKRGVRLIQINEPSKNDEMDVGYMKELTGKDEIQARALYGDVFYFRPQFQFVLICNKLPKVDANDGGTWRRIRAIPFEIQFLDHDQKIEFPGKQFYKDYDLEEKFENWKRAFMWYLLKIYYPKYRENNGFYVPPKVLECTKKYKKDSDFFFEFLDEFFELTKNNKDSEPFNDIASDFRTYVQEWWTGGKTTKPGKKDLLDYLDNGGYEKKGSKIYGIRYKTLDDSKDIAIDSFN